jgi:very-short-patch-repair endonuclease/DNA polymerase III delta prime subunit
MGSQVDISNIIANWQTKLLQLDRRNSLLYFRGQRSSVGILETSPDLLLDRLQRSRTGLKFPYAEARRRAASLSEPAREDEDHIVPGDLETDTAPVALQRRLLNLHRQDREWEEEQGVNVLYVVLGFINWVDEDGETARAPLLLVPADLERDSPRDPWRLKLEEDDLQTNETLRYQLSTLGVELPEYNHDSPSGYLEAVAQRISPKKGWSVEPAVALSTFPFAKMAMWEDLDEMRRQGTQHPVVRALGGDSGALRPPRDTVSLQLPRDEELHGGGLDKLLPVKEQFTVLPADHSQLRAIESARRGGHLVVHGPPGTGKSQTIANLIGTLLADGKRVLFVSEKTAALDVVKKRLEDCELGGFCLDLHSNRARKASVYQQIREALEGSRSAADSFPLATLEEQRERLNTVARALHEKRSPLGLSVFEVHGRFARVRSLRREDFPLRGIESLSPDTLSAIQEATARIARRKAEFKAHRESPWRALRRTDASIELADELRQAALKMRGAVSELQARGSLESRSLGLPAPGNLTEVCVAGRIAGQMANCPGIPETWLSQEALGRLDRRASSLATMQSDRHRLVESLDPFLGNGLPLLDFWELKALLSISFADDQKLKESIGVAWGQRLCPLPDSCERDLRDAVGCTRRLRESALLIAGKLCGQTRLDHLSLVRQVARRVRTAVDTAPVPESWFEPDGFSAVRRTLEQARGQLAGLEAAERRLFEEFDESLLPQVSHEMLVRYRADYQSPWRIFKKSYRTDQRTLRGCLRDARKLKLDEALAAIQSALQVRGLREEWEGRSNEYASAFGLRFFGRATDWEAIASTVAEIESWIQAWDWGPESAQRCFSAPGRAVAEPLVRDLEAALARWEASLLASRGAESDLDLSIRQSVLESGAEIVSRLARDGGPLWPHLQRPVTHWTQLTDLLSWAVQIRKIQAQEEDLAPALRQDFESYYDGPESDWRKVQAAIRWAHELLDLVGGRVPAELSKQCRQPYPSEHYAVQQERLSGTVRAFQARAADFSETFDPRPVGWSDWGTPEFERLTRWLSWIEEHADTALAWMEYTKAVQDLDGLLSPGAVDALRNNVDDAGEVPDLVLRRIYAAWIDHLCDKDARLRFQPRDHEALREEFRKLDRRFVHASRARVRAKCFRQYPEDSGPAIEWGQLGVLNHQLNLKRRQMPVRRLIQQIPQLLQALKPCFLMSPVAVSQYLSRGELATDCPIFDAVIFDEASQVFPQDAVPAIARAKQVIVVGDQKQLPPSSFFRSDTSDDDDEELTEDRLEGVESILDVMVGMEGGGVHSAYLDIHYRSRHEDLIRYSNHNFYKDRLLVFPSPKTSSGNLGLKDVYLPNGRYDAGASRTNRLEAEAAVHYVFELLRNRPAKESVGVVTLSRSQADLIEELVNERRLKDSSLDSRFAEDLSERFFVKNLENVQGDERDHIILSIGYGPTVGSGSVPNRFGPINLEGGGRRLNVAITRARRSLTLIRSLRPDQITAQSEGSRFLRRFLEYAQDPVRAFEKAIDVDRAAETESPFEEAVYRALTERGYRVSKQVGCFGYRIDLAIAAEDGDRYDLGIECDGAAYHRAPAARDRDWLRQSVLEGLGWAIHRVWSTDWIRDPEAQIQSIERALRAARARPQEAAVEDAPSIHRIDSASEVIGQGDSDKGNEGWVSKNTQGFRFVPYKFVEFVNHHIRIPIVEEKRQKLCELVTKVVEAEGPVHVDVVIDRIRRHYGAGRAGRQIQSAILDAVGAALNGGHVCWRTLQAADGPQTGSFLDMSKHPVRPEPRGMAEDGSVRSIEEVWPGEIEVGVLRVVETAFGVSREDAILAVARAFGYERVGRNIQEAITAAIDRLIKDGELPEGPGGLTPRH